VILKAEVDVSILSKSEVKAIAETLSNHEIFIISDEIYAENTFNGQHTSFAEFDIIRDQLLLIGDYKHA
jgi:aminotransferase